MCLKKLWDFLVQAAHVMEARRPDIIRDKESRKCQINYIAIQYNTWVDSKESEIILIDQDLAREL